MNLLELALRIMDIFCNILIMFCVTNWSSNTFKSPNIVSIVNYINIKFEEYNFLVGHTNILYLNSKGFDLNI